MIADTGVDDLKNDETSDGEDDEAVRVLKEFDVSSKKNYYNLDPKFIEALKHDLNELSDLIYSKALFYSSITTDLKNFGDIVTQLTKAIDKATDKSK